MEGSVNVTLSYVNDSLQMKATGLSFLSGVFSGFKVLGEEID
jgi:hypothetical protein